MDSLLCDILQLHVQLPIKSRISMNPNPTIEAYLLQVPLPRYLVNPLLVKGVVVNYQWFIVTRAILSWAREMLVVFILQTERAILKFFHAFNIK